MGIRTDKLLFLHIPKTGGTWVREVLRAVCPIREETKGHVAHLGRPRFDLYYSFCFVRHPLDWYKSFFNHRAKKQWSDPKTPESVVYPIDKCRSEDFHEFIDKCLYYYPSWLTWFYGQWLSMDLKFVGTMENIMQDLLYVLKQSGTNFNKDEVMNHKPVNIGYYNLKYSYEHENAIMDNESVIVKRFYSKQTKKGR